MSGVLTPAEIAYQQQHMEDDRTADILAAALISAILATAAIALRFTCRKLMKASIAWDDYWIIVGWVRASLYQGVPKALFSLPQP